METEKKNLYKKKFKALVKDAISLVMTFAITSAVCKLTFTYALDKNVVKGSSMEPTLHNEDQLLATRIFSIDPGDIVTIESEKLGEKIVKRVIATGGQEVNIDFEEGSVYVDGIKLNEQLYQPGEKLTGDYFVNTLTQINSGAFDEYPVTVPEGYIFVMGDNRNASLDSKNRSLGLVPVEEVCGQVIMKTFPFKDIKFY